MTIYGVTLRSFQFPKERTSRTQRRVHEVSEVSAKLAWCGTTVQVVSKEWCVRNEFIYPCRRCFPTYQFGVPIEELKPENFKPPRRRDREATSIDRRIGREGFYEDSELVIVQVSLSAEVFEAAKQLARKQNVTLDALVEENLKLALPGGWQL